MYQTHLHNHCSWTLQEPCHRFQETLSRRVYNHTFTRIGNMKQIHLMENAKICLRLVEQIAHTVAAPLTKP